MAGLFVAAMAGCGVPDGGGWDPISGPPAPEGPTGTISDVVTPPPTGTAEPTPVGDRASLISCEMPPAVEIDLYAGEGYPYYVNEAGGLCLGEEESLPSPALCWKVHAFEAHAAAVAACYAEAQKELDRQGSRIMGREWRPLAEPMLPAAWSKGEEEVAALSTQVTEGMVHLLTGGKANYASGAPLCFPFGSGLTPDQARNELVQDMKDLVRATTGEVSSVLAALKRGVNLQVTKDLRLSLAVILVERQSNTEAIGECKFHAAK